MRYSARLVSLVVGCFAVSFLLTGCGKSKVKVTGTVLRAKKPIPLSKTGILRVTLVPVVESGQGFTTLPTRADAEGNFEILNVLPGKYRIAVEQLDPDPRVDKLSGAFSPKNTKITREIDGLTPLSIDLADPAG